MPQLLSSVRRWYVVIGSKLSSLDGYAVHGVDPETGEEVLIADGLELGVAQLIAAAPRLVAALDEVDRFAKMSPALRRLVRGTIMACGSEALPRRKRERLAPKG